MCPIRRHSVHACYSPECYDTLVSAFITHHTDTLAYDRHSRADNNYAEFCHLTHKTHGVRRDGAASLDLAYVACGRLEGYWERGLSPWDLAAGVVILEEAGGRVTAYDQSAFDLRSGRILATNGLVHAELSQELLSIHPLSEFSGES